MSTARERIIGAVRSGLLRAELPDSSAERPSLDLKVPAGSPDEMAERFTAAFTALTGKVYYADGASQIADTVAGILDACRARSFLSWDESEMGCPGLLAALASRGLQRVTYDLPFDAAGRDAAVQALEGIGAGLTGADAALADSGALVLASGHSRGRMASLLPPVHVAIVSRARLFPSLPAFIGAQPSLVDASSNLVVIAGPSRTADIEMTLTHGVHGPKQVHVILTA